MLGIRTQPGHKKGKVCIRSKRGREGRQRIHPHSHPRETNNYNNAKFRRQCCASKHAQVVEARSIAFPSRARAHGDSCPLMPQTFPQTITPAYPAGVTKVGLSSETSSFVAPHQPRVLPPTTTALTRYASTLTAHIFLAPSKVYPMIHRHAAVRGGQGRRGGARHCRGQSVTGPS